jgi:hypothetical protein
MPIIEQTREVGDLTVLTVKRVRQQILLALQLIDDDDQKATVLIGCAVDLINAASDMMEHDGKVDPTTAMMTVVGSVLAAVDNPKIKSVVRSILTKHMSMP